jgi:hypothetical protein
MKSTKELNEIYFEILDELYDSNMIGKDVFLDRNMIYDEKDLFFALQNLKLNEIVLVSQISQKFNYKLFVFDDLDEDALVVTDGGVICDGCYYFLNPFYNYVANLVSKNKEFGNYFFTEIGVISEYNYNQVKKIKRRGKSMIAASDQIKRINTLSVIYDAIELGASEIVINKNLDKIIFSKDNNSFDSQFSVAVDIQSISDVIKYRNEKYFVKSEQINKTLRIMHINKYVYVPDFLNDEPKYSSGLLHHMKSSNGLILLSEKYQTDYYYYFLDKMFKDNPQKNILSVDTTRVSVGGITQLTKEDFLGGGTDKAIKDCDVLFYEGLDNIADAEIVYKALNLGKLVFVKLRSQDAITALAYLIHEFPSVLKGTFLSEKLITVYHTSVLPKICTECSTKVLLKNHDYRLDPQFSLLFSTNDTSAVSVSRANSQGCPKCKYGYEGKVLISELLDYDKSLASEIESGFNIRMVRNLKSSERWETVQENAMLQLLRGYISLEDIKSKI